MDPRDARTAEMSVGTRMLDGTRRYRRLCSYIGGLLYRTTKHSVQAPSVCLINNRSTRPEPQLLTFGSGTVAGGLSSGIQSD